MTMIDTKEVIVRHTKRASAAPLSTVRTANARSRHQSNDIRSAAIRGSLYHTNCVLSSPAAPTKEFGMRPHINATWQRLRYTLLGMLFLISTFAVIYSS